MAGDDEWACEPSWDSSAVEGTPLAFKMEDGIFRRGRIALFVYATVSSFLGMPAAQAAVPCPSGAQPHRCSTPAAVTSGGAAVGSFYGSISGDGDHIAFSSAGAVAGGVAGQQVYVRDLTSNTSTLVSRATTAAGAAGNGASYAPAVSDNGNVVAFLSDSTNLTPLDPNGATEDAFVRNLSDATTVLLTAGTNPLTGADSDTTDITISGDGTKIAFVSFASNLVTGDTNDVPEVFVINADGSGLVRGATSATGVQGNDFSYKPSLSDNGRYLAFASTASNLVPGDINGVGDVFIKDLQDGTITRATGPGGVAGNGQSGNSGVDISDDGTIVAFGTAASNLVASDTNGTEDVAIWNAAGGITYAPKPSSAGVQFPSLSGNGQIVTYKDALGPPGDKFIYVAGVGASSGFRKVERSLNAATGVSTAMPAGAQLFAWNLSDDGTVLAYETDVDVSNDTNAATDVYLYTTDLDGPTVTVPAAATTITNDTTPAIAATLQGRGNGLEVRDQNNSVVGFVQTVAPSNSASLSTSELPQGSHTLSIREIDRPHTSAAVTRTFIIDSVAPAGVAITAPANGATIGDAAPVISGTAGISAGDSGSISVQVFNASAVQQGPTLTPAVQPNGSWSVTSPALPANGGYSIVATQTDHAANSSNASTSFTLSAGVPTVSITSPVSGPANSAAQTIQGTLTGAPSGTLSITGMAPITITPTSGVWSESVSLAPDGLFSISASATNIAGTGTSGTVLLDVDTTLPAAPAVTSPLPGATVQTQTPLIVGTSEANATIHLTLDDVAVSPNPIADGSGNWSYQTGTLAQGGHTLSVQAEDGASNLSPSTNLTFTVDSLAPLAPVLSSPAHGATLTTSTVSAAGTGEPGATLTVYEGAVAVGSTTVSPSGFWQVPALYSNGLHTIHAVQVDASNLSSPPSASRSFTVDPTAIPTSISTPLDNSTAGTRNVSVAGRAKPNGNIQVYLVDGFTETLVPGSVSVDAGGSWSKVVRLNDGTYTVRAKETTTVTVSNDRTFTVVSGVPVITSPAAGATVGPNFVVQGTALPGASVSVRVGAQGLGTGTANPAGQWSIPVTRPDGNATLIAHAGAGTSRTEDSDPVSVIVDATGPTVNAAPDAAIMGTLLGTPVRISGTATDMSTIVSIKVVYRNAATGTTLTSTTVVCGACGSSNNVTFSDTPTGLTPGRWSAQVTATDIAGNTGIPGSAVFTVVA